MARIFGVLFILLGAALALGGWIFRGAGGALARDAVVEILPIAVTAQLRTVIELFGAFTPQFLLDLLQFSSSGYLFFGAAFGGIFLVAGYLIAFRNDRHIKVSESASEKSEFAEQRETEADELVLPSLDEDGDKKIARLVQVEQMLLDRQACEKIVRAYHPAATAGFPFFSPGFMEAVARKSLAIERIRAGRTRKGMTPKQFGNLQEKLVEVEREICGRRLLPKDAEKVPEEHRRHIGHAFNLNDQQKIQQDTSTEADDWVDISMNTIDSIFADVDKSSQDAGLHLASKSPGEPAVAPTSS